MARKKTTRKSDVTRSVRLRAEDQVLLKAIRADLTRDLPADADLTDQAVIWAALKDSARSRGLLQAAPVDVEPNGAGVR